MTVSCVIITGSIVGRKCQMEFTARMTSQLSSTVMVSTSTCGILYFLHWHRTRSNDQQVEIVSSGRYMHPRVILPHRRSLLLITSVSKSSHQTGEDATGERSCPCFDPFRESCALLPTDWLSGSNPCYFVVFPSEKFDPSTIDVEFV